MSTNVRTRTRVDHHRSARLQRERERAFLRDLRAIDGLRVQGIGR
jgi:hypothetical protein